jgi:hypothetical protein
MTFHRYNSLYFWSLLGCTTGVMWFNGGFLDLFFKMYLQPDGTHDIYEPLFILTIGWYAMVTGFALILYSRLHLIGVPKRVLQRCRMMIAFNVVCSHFPTTTLTFGANIIGTPVWVNGYAGMEKLQMTLFSLQEIALNSLYLYYIRRLTLDRKLTRLVQQTVIINIIVIMLDISMLATQYADLYTLQIMMKTMIYSVKIKLEFYILNTLTRHFDKKEEMMPNPGASMMPSSAVSEAKSPKNGAISIRTEVSVHS